MNAAVKKDDTDAVKKTAAVKKATKPAVAAKAAKPADAAKSTVAAKTTDAAKSPVAAKAAKPAAAKKAVKKESVSKPSAQENSAQAAAAAAQAAEKDAVARRETPRLQQLYYDEIVPEIMKKHGYKSPLAAPRLIKITLSMGVGEAINDKKKLQVAMADLEKIAGLKPVITRARKSIAGFKSRKGYPLGCMVTLRRRRMYDFLDRLITAALPRSRDFRGLKAKAFDGRGNYSLGITEQIIFHEIQYEEVDSLRGLNVSLVTTAQTDDAARELLLGLGLPIQQPGSVL